MIFPRTGPESSATRWLFEGPLCRPLRFGLVGMTGILVNLVVLTSLVELGKVDHAVAAGLAGETAIMTNFLLNDRWTFADARPSGSAVARLAHYNLIAVGGLLLSVALVAGLTRGFGHYYLPANLIAIGASFCWNYTLTSQLAWAVRPPVRLAVPVQGRPR